MLMVLPTPELCISSAERWPPSQAPAAIAMPSSSVVSARVRTELDFWQASISLECRARGGIDGCLHVLGLVDRVKQHPHRLEHLGRALSHGILPGIELAVVAPHRDERQEWKAQCLGQSHHVDGIANTRALHQQRGALATEPGTRGDRDAFLLGRQGQGPDRVRFLAGLDQPGVPGIRYMIDLLDVMVLKDLEDVVAPIVHGSSL